MANSKYIAGLLGPSIVAVTISETLNIQAWNGLKLSIQDMHRRCFKRQSSIEPFP